MSYTQRVKEAAIWMMFSAIYTMLTKGELFNPQMYEAYAKKHNYILSPDQRLQVLAKRFGLFGCQGS